MTSMVGAMRLLMIGALLFLGACRSAPAPTQAASLEYTKSVSDQTVPVGKSRVFFKQGTFEGNMRIFGPEDVKGTASLFANDKRIGGVNYGEYLVVDIAPGHYAFTWKGGWDYEYASMSAPAEVDLKPGQIVYLTANVYQETRLEPVVGLANDFSSSLQVCFSNYCLNDFRKAKLVVSGQ